MVDSLEEALKHRIVLEQGDAYDFGHDRIRDVAYAEISRARRRLLHGRVAVAIESVHAANLDEVSGELAHHHEQAGNLGQAAGYLRRAGQRVAAQFAHEEAVAYYTRALALLPETEPEKRIELLLLREAIYTLQTDKKKRYGDVQEMLRLVESLEVDPAKIDRYRARIKLRQVMYVGSQGNVQEAIRLAESAVTLAQAAGATDVEAEAYWYWGRELWARANLEEAIAVLEKSIRLARQVGDDDLEARALEFVAAAGAFSGAPTSRILGQLGRCMEIHQQNVNLFGQAAIGGKIGYLRMQFLDDLMLAKHTYEESLRLAERTGDMERCEIVLSNLGDLAVWVGNYDKGERLLAEALQLGRRRGYHYRIEAVQFNLGFACANRGDFKSAKAHFEEGIRTHNQIGAEQFLSSGYCSYSLSNHYDGDQQAAEVMARNALTVTRKLGDSRREGEALVCLDHALAAQDRLDEAANAYAQGVALHRTLEHTRHSLEALAGLAHVADRKGETDSALSYLEEILQDLASN